MRKHLATIILVALAVVLQASPFTPATTATDAFEQQVVDLINQERASRGLPPLVIHHLLEAAAEAHSTDMGDNRFCGHDSSDGTPWNTRIQGHGYTPYYGLAENVACGQTSPASAVTSWMNSPPHRDNILGDYEHVGAGYYYNGGVHYGHYWTLDFGKPSPNTPPPDTCSLEHDFDNNGVIGVGDLQLQSQCWGDNQPCDPMFDVNSDNANNVIDVSIVASEFGTTCQ